MEKLEEAINAHLRSNDNKIGTYIDELISKGMITEKDFEIRNNEKYFTFNDQDNNEIIYNYNLRRVYSYGGYLNENEY